MLGGSSIKILSREWRLTDGISNSVTPLCRPYIDMLCNESFGGSINNISLRGYTTVATQPR